MSFFDKMKDAGEDIKDAFAEGAHDLAEKAGEIKDAAADKAGDIKDAETPADHVVGTERMGDLVVAHL